MSEISNNILSLALHENGIKSVGVEIFREPVQRHRDQTSEETRYDSGIPREPGSRQPRREFSGNTLLNNDYCAPPPRRFGTASKNDLDNPVLSILDPEINKWQADPDLGESELLESEKKLLLPALRLTSRFIIHEHAAYFWQSLFFQRTPIYKGKDPINLWEIIERRNPTTIHENALKARVGNASPHIVYCFSKNIDPDGKQCWPYSRTGFFFHGVPDINSKVRPNANYNYRIVLHEDLLKTLRAFDQMPEDETRHARTGFNFFLMTLLCRELAFVLDHQWAVSNKISGHAQHKGTHTRWKGNVDVDVKQAAQIALFGGLIVPISRRCDTLHGLAIRPWDKRIKEYRERSYAIPIKHLRNFQREEHWSTLVPELEDFTHLHIPLKGEGIDLDR